MCPGGVPPARRADSDARGAAPLAPAPARHLGWHVAAAALALTLLNAAKPPTMDDPSYLLHAQRVAAQPLDPYGGEMFTYQTWGPALHNNAPPVAIYWLGLGTRALGDHLFGLKLWLLPWGLVLGAGLASLLARWAPGAAAPAVWLALLSPAVLPAFDFMIDVPSLALIVASVALFVRALEGGAVPGAALAGLVAGLAMQTKYTGITAPAAMLAIGLLARRPRLALVACGVSAAVFVGVEALAYGRYGDSPLLHYLGRRARGASGEPRASLVMPMLRNGGVLAAALVPLALAALGARGRVIALACGAIVGALAAYALLPAGAVAALDGVTGGRGINFENLTLGVAAAVPAAVIALLVGRLVRRRDATDLALLAWLAVETVAYFTVSTAPGARRQIGMLTVLALVAAREASLHVAAAPGRRALPARAAAFGVALGLALWAVDVDDAVAQRDDVARVLDRVRSAGVAASDAPATVWYAGNHFGGFQYHAPRAGMRPAISGHSVLRPGDWLVIPLFVQEDYLRLDRDRLAPVERLAPRFRLPVTTRFAYYGGGRPIRRPEPGWVAASIYRVTSGGVIVQEDLRRR